MYRFTDKFNYGSGIFDDIELYDPWQDQGFYAKHRGSFMIGYGQKSSLKVTYLRSYDTIVWACFHTPLGVYPLRLWQGSSATTTRHELAFFKSRHFGMCPALELRCSPVNTWHYGLNSYSKGVGEHAFRHSTLSPLDPGTWTQGYRPIKAYSDYWTMGIIHDVDGETIHEFENRDKKIVFRHWDPNYLRHKRLEGLLIEFGTLQEAVEFSKMDIKGKRAAAEFIRNVARGGEAA